MTWVTLWNTEVEHASSLVLLDKVLDVLDNKALGLRSDDVICNCAGYFTLVQGPQVKVELLLGDDFFLDLHCFG